MKGDPKYLSYFPPGSLFAWRMWGGTPYHRRVILTEGALDCMWLHQHGYYEAISAFSCRPSGTQIERLSSLGVEVVIAFDGDKAGRQAGAELAAELPKARVVNLPDGRDVQELSEIELGVLFHEGR
jgi:DNA primase